MKTVCLLAACGAMLWPASAVELEATPESFVARFAEACALRRTETRPVALTLAPGDYPIAQTLALSPATCGGTGAALAIRGEWGLPRPRLLGSVPLRNWRRVLPYDEMGLVRSRYRPVPPREAEGAREHPEWFTISKSKK